MHRAPSDQNTVFPPLQCYTFVRVTTLYVLKKKVHNVNENSSY